MSRTSVFCTSALCLALGACSTLGEWGEKIGSGLDTGLSALGSGVSSLMDMTSGGVNSVQQTLNAQVAPATPAVLYATEPGIEIEYAQPVEVPLAPAQPLVIPQSDGSEVYVLPEDDTLLEEG